MIYEFPDMEDPIRQGDIFMGLPRMDISLSEVIIVGEIEQRLAKWDEVAKKGEPVDIIVSVRPVTSIVATQDCDAQHSRDITLCEIREFKEVEGKARQTNAPKSWKNLITQHARINQKWFYLPPDDRLGFREKMAVDFMVTLRVPRKDLETLRSMRRGRLNSLSDEHFRERIADFFRRYPYNEWYPLNVEEMAVYIMEYSDAIPYPWQKFEQGSTESNK